MSVAKILYLGNKISSFGYTPTGVEFLGSLFETNGHSLRYAGERKSKAMRLIQMISSIMRNRNWANVVVIDTFSTLAFYYAVLAGFIARLLNKKYILVLHGGNLPFRVDRSPKLSKKLFEGAYHIISPSRYLQLEFQRRNFVTKVIPNPISIRSYRFKIRKDIKPKLLWVRSFHKNYNPEMALRVIYELGNIYNDVDLCMVGPDKDGSLMRCKELAFKLQVSKKIKFTGILEKSKWIELSEEYDIFINTTNYDNMPVSVIEAMALGLPIVSTNVGGIPFLINEANGYLCTNNDPSSMCNRIKEITETPQLAVKKAQKARQLVEHYDSGEVLNKWNSLLNRLK